MSIVSPVYGEITSITNNSIEIYISSSDNHNIFAPISGKITNINLDKGFWKREIQTKYFKTIEYKTGRLTVYIGDVYFWVEVGKPKYITDTIRFDYNINDDIIQGQNIGEIIIGSLAKIYFPPDKIKFNDIYIGKKLEGGISELVFIT